MARPTQKDYTRRLHPCILDETPQLKHGDVFTVGVDKTAANWRMVDGKTFIAVPRDYQSPSLKEEWAHRIAAAEKEWL